MRRRVGAATTAAAVAAVALLAGCTSDGSGGGANGYVEGDGTVQLLGDDERREPVALAAPTLDGERLDIASFRGKVTVVNVWASWCGPCRKEAPELKAAAAELGPEGVAFVGVNSRDTADNARAFERKYGPGFPSIVDSGPQMLAFGGAIPPSAFPTTLLLDERGRVAARFSGPITKITLADMVDDVRASSAA